MGEVLSKIVGSLMNLVQLFHLYLLGQLQIIEIVFVLLKRISCVEGHAFLA
jgi:hypothetical protein